MWKEELNMKVNVSSVSFINCLVFSKQFATPWLLTCIYGPLIPSRRQLFWESLDNIENSHKDPWLVIGDFNFIISSDDKHAGKSSSNL